MSEAIEKKIIALAKKFEEALEVYNEEEPQLKELEDEMMSKMRKIYIDSKNLSAEEVKIMVAKEYLEHDTKVTEKTVKLYKIQKKAFDKLRELYQVQVQYQNNFINALRNKIDELEKDTLKQVPPAGPSEEPPVEKISEDEEPSENTTDEPLVDKGKGKAAEE